LRHRKQQKLGEFAKSGYSPLQDIAGAGEKGTRALKNLVDATKSVGQMSALTLGTGIAAPFGIGALGGYLTGRGQDVSTEDIDEFKKRELIAEYKRLTEQAKRSRLTKDYAQQVQQTGRVF
jgi:hypothetical protein